MTGQEEEVPVVDPSGSENEEPPDPSQEEMPAGANLVGVGKEKGSACAVAHKSEQRIPDIPPVHVPLALKM